MRFIKVSHEGKHIQWNLVIDNEVDLMKYLNLNINNIFYSYLYINKDTIDVIKNSSYIDLEKNLEKFNLNQIELSIAKILSSKIYSTEENTTFQPMFTIADYLDKKAIGMLKALKYDNLLIKENGGYSLMKNYFNIWNCTILEEIHKNDFGFPIEKEIIKTDILIIENAPMIDKSFLNSIKEKYHKKSIGYIVNLKQADQNYLFKCLQHSQIICTQTEALDIEQVDNFIKMFLLLKDKTVLIKTSIEGKERIISNDLYNKLSHSISFEV